MQIINVMAASLDGKIALHDDESDAARRAYGFTNKDDQDFVRSMLESADAVVTGAKSLRASGAAWQVRNHKGQLPAWVVLTTRGISSSLRFWDQVDTERWLVSPQPLDMSNSQGVKNLCYGAADPVIFTADALRAAGFSTVLLFGGGEINRMFYQAGLVDELRLTICPIILARNGASNLVEPQLDTPVKFQLESSHVAGSLVFLKYTVLKS